MSSPRWIPIETAISLSAKRALLSEGLNRLSTGHRTLQIMLSGLRDTEEHHEAIILVALEEAAVTVHNPTKPSKQLVVPADDLARIGREREGRKARHLGHENDDRLTLARISPEAVAGA